MASTSLRARTQPTNWLVLAAFVVGVVAAGAVVGIANSPGSWYDSLDKPPGNPPSGIFGPVWTVLYVMIAASGYLAWSATRGVARTTAMSAWTVQLLLNLAWSLVFFGLQRPGWALVEIVALARRDRRDDRGLRPVVTPRRRIAPPLPRVGRLCDVPDCRHRRVELISCPPEHGRRLPRTICVKIAAKRAPG